MKIQLAWTAFLQVCRGHSSQGIKWNIKLMLRNPYGLRLSIFALLRCYETSLLEWTDLRRLWSQTQQDIVQLLRTRTNQSMTVHRPWAGEDLGVSFEKRCGKGFYLQSFQYGGCWAVFQELRPQKCTCRDRRRWVASTHWVPPQCKQMSYVSLLCIAMPIKALFEKKKKKAVEKYKFENCCLTYPSVC